MGVVMPLNIIEEFVDIDADTLNALGLNTLHEPLVPTQEMNSVPVQEMNGDAENAEDILLPLKENDDNDNELQHASSNAIPSCSYQNQNAPPFATASIVGVNT